MFRHRYSTWDGSRPLRLDADKLFERLSGHLSETDNLGEALDRMLREGFEDQSFRVAGILRMKAMAGQCFDCSRKIGRQIPD